MKRTRTLPIALAVASLLALIPTGDASACGDKFLVIGRTARRVPKAKHPGAILLAVRANDLKVASAVRSMKLEATLRKAGHEVETIAAPASLQEMLAARRYDFVVTGLDGAAAVVKESASLASRPEVVPVSLAADPDGRAAAEQGFGLVIDASSKTPAYLAALDAAMARRRKP